MPNISDITILRRKLPLFLVVDCSDSMRYSINNDELKSIIYETVKNVDDHAGYDYDICVGLLTYGTNVNWIGDGIVSVKDFHADISDFEGLSDVGSAFNELNKRLSRRAFLKDIVYNPYLKPIFVFIGDGCSTDDYYESLEKLKSNKWFKDSPKICVLTGKDQNLFLDIASRDAIISAKDPHIIARIIVKMIDSMIAVYNDSPMMDEDDFNIYEKNDIEEIMKPESDVNDSWGDDDSWS